MTKKKIQTKKTGIIKLSDKKIAKLEREKSQI